MSGEAGRAFSTCFNPRLPRGRRRVPPAQQRGRRSFNPRLPRGRRHARGCPDRGAGRFQSAPPAREATMRLGSVAGASTGFNPRLPRGRRRDADRLAAVEESVSIRASRAGGDATASAESHASRGFNPRLPRGRRRGRRFPAVYERVFQSAPPAREATSASTFTGLGKIVSIRASRAGGDGDPEHRRPEGAVSIRASRAGGDR